jgi:hypothetical protein
MPTPNMRTLGTTAEGVVDRASKKAVSDIFQRNNNCINGEWLHITNFYLEDTINKVEDLPINSTDLGTYLSVSAPSHCIDGWTYLSRSVNSLIHGDFHTARHLAYYAELRAAISILATEGIGVLNRKHFIIDRHENCVPIALSRGTHEIAWELLAYWATKQSASNLIGSIIMPYGVKLIDWHSEFESASTFPAIAANWLTSWGLDLRQLHTDHNTRNIISYRPYRMISQTPTVPAEVLQFVRALWFTFMPSGISKFGELDGYLLNKSLHSANVGLGLPPNKYGERVAKTVSALFSDMQPELVNSYINFLSQEQDSSILKHASLQDDSSQPNQVYQMISRASLLLRLATGASAELLASTGHAWSDFEFWWKALGNDIGFWELGDELDDPNDLWEDIRNSIIDMDESEANTPISSTFNLHTTKTNAKNLWTLSGTERIALWGLHR